MWKALGPPTGRRFDEFVLMDIFFEHLGRNLDCECQVLYDERELRKEALRRQFGVDLDGGEVGLRSIFSDLAIYSYLFELTLI